MQRRFPYRFAGLAVTALLSTSASARSSGISGRTDPAGTGCGGCHGARSDQTTVTVDGPSALTAGATGSYSLTLSGGPAIVGGFNVSVSAGVLVPGQGSKLLDGQLVHATSRTAVNGSIRFDFQLTAPLETGALVLHAVGNSANGDGRSDGDMWNFAAPLNIDVSASPEPSPTAPPAAPPEPSPAEETPQTPVTDAPAPDAAAEETAAEETAEEAVPEAGQGVTGCSAASGPLGIAGLLLAAAGVTRRRRG